MTNLRDMLVSSLVCRECGERFHFTRTRREMAAGSELPKLCEDCQAIEDVTEAMEQRGKEKPTKLYNPRKKKRPRFLRCCLYTNEELKRYAQ